MIEAKCRRLLNKDFNLIYKAYQDDCIENSQNEVWASESNE